jgi:integrase/recombinase XerD
MWEPYKKGYKAYLELEKSLSHNSVEAYLHDIEKLTSYLLLTNQTKSPSDINLKDLEAFIKWIAELGMTPGSQSRIISGLRSFFTFCQVEQITNTNPTTLLEAPKLKRKLPEVLSFDEIEKILSEIDMSTAEGGRNKAILETLYSCGLRVSEVVNLRISNLYTDVGFIKVTGKGDKERLVPIGSEAIKFITSYRNDIRVHINVKKGNDDILF